MRLFIAINFAEAVKDDIEASADLLREHSLSGNFSLRENYHITLAFLGETGADKLASVREAMDSCRGQKMRLTLERLGCFGRGDSTIAWRAVKAPRVLWELQEQLLKELCRRGFSPDDKKFKPHLTLARQLVLRPGVSLNELSKVIAPCEFTAESMELMKSERVGGKLRYTKLYSRAFREA